MRAALATSALSALVVTLTAVASEPTTAFAAPAYHHHFARLRHYPHLARPYHIPRFNQGEAEAFVHTVYPYRTGLYVPWPDAYAGPYPYYPYPY